MTTCESQAISGPVPPLVRLSMRFVAVKDNALSGYRETCAHRPRRNREKPARQGRVVAHLWPRSCKNVSGPRPGMHNSRREVRLVPPRYDRRPHVRSHSQGSAVVGILAVVICRQAEGTRNRRVESKSHDQNWRTNPHHQPYFKSQRFVSFVVFVTVSWTWVFSNVP